MFEHLQTYFRILNFSYFTAETLSAANTTYKLVKGIQSHKVSMHGITYHWCFFKVRGNLMAMNQGIIFLKSCWCTIPDPCNQFLSLYMYPNFLWVQSKHPEGSGWRRGWKNLHRWLMPNSEGNRIYNHKGRVHQCSNTFTNRICLKTDVWE